MPEGWIHPLKIEVQILNFLIHINEGGNSCLIIMEKPRKTGTLLISLKMNRENWDSWINNLALPTSDSLNLFRKVFIFKHQLLSLLPGTVCHHELDFQKCQGSPLPTEVKGSHTCSEPLKINHRDADQHRKITARWLHTLLYSIKYCFLSLIFADSTPFPPTPFLNS